MKEIWKSVKKYENIYEVSSNGNVRSIDRIINTKSGERYIKGRMLKQTKDSFGYLKVVLCKDGIHETYSVHRLVAEAFIPNPENKPTVDHINTDKTDNKVSNLRWFTQKEQMTSNEITRGKLVNSLACANMVNKSNNYEVSKKNLKNAYDSVRVKVRCVETNEVFESAADASRFYNLDASTISACCRGKRKTHGNFHWEYVKIDPL